MKQAYRRHFRRHVRSRVVQAVAQDKKAEPPTECKKDPKMKGCEAPAKK